MLDLPLLRWIQGQGRSNVESGLTFQFYNTLQTFQLDLLIMISNTDQTKRLPVRSPLQTSHSVWHQLSPCQCWKATAEMQTLLRGGVHLLTTWPGMKMCNLRLFSSAIVNSAVERTYLGSNNTISCSSAIQHKIKPLHVQLFLSLLDYTNHMAIYSLLWFSRSEQKHPSQCTLHNVIIFITAT